MLEEYYCSNKVRTTVFTEKHLSTSINNNFLTGWNSKNINSYYKLMPTITKIVTQSSHPDRINIFIDDKFFTGIDKFAWISHNLKTGDNISPQLCEELKKKDVEGKAYDKALKLLSFRPQSIFEIRQKLKSRFTPEHISQTIARLKKEGWLDDKKFALAWVTERIQTRHRSLLHLKSELIQKGISADIIAQILKTPELENQELATAQQLIIKYQGSSGRTGKTPEQIKAYLSRKGFRYNTINQVLKSVK